jgi:hypothetical protein
MFNCKKIRGKFSRKKFCCTAKKPPGKKRFSFQPTRRAFPRARALASCEVSRRGTGSQVATGNSGRGGEGGGPALCPAVLPAPPQVLRTSFTKKIPAIFLFHSEQLLKFLGPLSPSQSVNLLLRPPPPSPPPPASVCSTLQSTCM